LKKYTNEELTENIINMLKEKTKKDYKKNHIKREAHSKCLGLLKAQFIVNENSPNEVIKEATGFESLLTFA